MWIQVCIIDGFKMCIIEDVFCKVMIEELCEWVWVLFDVWLECQCFFYWGKQLENGYILFDYDVGLNDIIQLLVCLDFDYFFGIFIQIEVKFCFNSLFKVKKVLRVGFFSQLFILVCVCFIDFGFGIYKVNELVDVRDVGFGVWFEVYIYSVIRVFDGQLCGKILLKNGSFCKRINGNIKYKFKENINKLDSVFFMFNLDFVVVDEDVIYYIQYDEYLESGILEMNVKDFRL